MIFECEGTGLRLRVVVTEVDGVKEWTTDAGQKVLPWKYDDAGERRSVVVVTAKGNYPLIRVE
jgi:hypothetical protein